MRGFLFFGALGVAIVSFGVPGGAGLGLVILLFLPFVAVWWFVLLLTSGGSPSDAVRHVKRHRLLGPGGPDDPFADEPFEDEPGQ